MPPYDPRPRNHKEPHKNRVFDEPDGFPPLEELFYRLNDMEVMFDGSLFTSNAIEDTTSLIEDLEDTEITCYVSARFVDAIEHYMERGRESQTDALSFFEPYDGFEDLERIRGIIASTETVEIFDLSRIYGRGDLEEFLQEYYRLVSVIDSQYNTDEEYEPMFNQGFRLADIIYEELIFGLTHSKITSRLKKIYQKFSEAVGPLLEITKEDLGRLYGNISQAAESSAEQFQEMWESVSDTAEQTHLKELLQIQRLQTQFKNYSPNWIGAPMRITIPMLVGALFSPAGLIPGMFGQAVSIGGSLMAYEGCVWLADP